MDYKRTNESDYYAHDDARPHNHAGATRRMSSRSQTPASRYSRTRSQEQYGESVGRSSASFYGGAQRGGASYPSHAQASQRPSARTHRATSDDETARTSPTPRMTRQQYVARQAQRRKKIVVIAAAVVAVVLFAGVAAFGYIGGIFGNFGAGIDDDLRNVLVETDMANEPFYMLLMGTDGSAERDASGDFGESYRTDSIMLARIDPVDKKLTLVSIHRDTLVDMGEYGQQKLNAAHALEGPSLSVEVVSKMAGVPISHYAEINFDGFRDVVNALGGIEVDVPMTIDDADAGGHLDAGLQTLNGDQALILCRSRHAYDEMGDGDSYRAANQRLVLSAIAKKLLSSDIVTMTSTVQTLSQYVTTDLSLTDIIGLAQAMQGLDTATNMYTAMEPTTSEYINNIWYEITDETAWAEMMRRVDQGLPPTEEDIVEETSGTILADAGTGQFEGRDSSLNADGSIRRSGLVTVRNGNGINGAGEEASRVIQEMGYQVDSGNADTFDYPQTMVIYGASAQQELAQELQRKLGCGTLFLNDGTFAFDGDFLVVLGADWQSPRAASDGE
ncbi:LCP family protein [Eggerthellaceae bacterium 3-80]